MKEEGRKNEREVEKNYDQKKKTISWLEKNKERKEKTNKHEEKIHMKSKKKKYGAGIQKKRRPYKLNWNGNYDDLGMGTEMGEA